MKICHEHRDITWKLCKAQTTTIMRKTGHAQQRVCYANTRHTSYQYQFKKPPPDGADAQGGGNLWYRKKARF